MKEYIEREQAIDLFYPVSPENDGSDGCTIIYKPGKFSSSEIEAMLSDLPTADVAEVRHGRWEEIRDPYGNLEGWLCECGREVKSKDNYCPSCGVRMDKEDKHEVKCAKCGEIKEIICTVDGKPWCEDCLDRAMGWPLHLTKSSEAQNERNPFQSQAAK